MQKISERVKVFSVIMLLTGLLLGTGCSGSQELDDLSFVLTIGVDNSDEPDMYVFSYRIAMPKAFAGDGGGDGKEKTKVVSVKAASLSDSIKQLALVMNRPVGLSHASAVFIHEAVARQGIYPILSPLIHSYMYRNSIIVLVTQEEAKMVLEKNTAPFELFQYRWIDSVERVQKFTASYNLNDIREFNVRMQAPQQAIMTGLGAITENTLERHAQQPLLKHAEPQYLPSTLPRQGGTELLVTGSVIFNDWKMVGILNSSESFGAMLLQKPQRTVLTLPDPVVSGRKTGIGIRTEQPRIKAAMLDNGSLKLKIDLNAEFQLEDRVSGVDYQDKELRRQLERQTEAALRENIRAYFTATQQLGTDCIGVTDRYRSQVVSWSEFADYDWPELYRSAAVEINVTARLKNVGFLGKNLEEGGEM